MQPYRETAGAHVGELSVHPRLGIVEPSAGGNGQSLRQPSHRRLVGKP